MIRISRGITASVLIDLSLARIQKHQQPWVVCLASVINQRIEQIRRRHRRVSREIGGAPGVKRDCISTVLEDAVIENQIHARNCCVTQSEVTVCIRAEAIQIEYRVRLVGAAVEEDDDQTIQRSTSSSPIKELYEFSCVCARLIGIDFVDDYVGRRRRGR